MRKRWYFPSKENFFPIADGRIKTLGGDQDLRTSTLIRHRSIQGESHVNFLGESEGSLPPSHDSFPDAGEAINDFWSMSGNFIYRHHVEPRVKLYSPREEAFPLQLKYIDVSRTTCTNLDVKQEKTHRWFLEYWWVKRLVWSLDRFSLNLLYWKKNLLVDICRQGGDKQENSRHPGQIIYGQKSGKQWERIPSWKRRKSGPMQSSILKTHENCEESLSSTQRIRNSRKPSRTRVRTWKHESLLLCLGKLW